MKNKILFASVLALATTTLQAQDMYDVARLSTSDLQGTARYIGMGGAMGALGADLTAMNSNPAGLGIYRSNDVAATLGVSMLNNGTAIDETSRVSFDQLGIVFTNKYGNYTSLKYINFGFNYRKHKNFFDDFSVSNNWLGEFSQTYQMADMAFGETDPNKMPALPAAAVKAGALGMNESGELAGTGAYNTTYSLKSTGGIHEYDFAVAANWSDQYFLGLSLAYFHASFDRGTWYTEYGEDDCSYDMYNYYSTRGSGMNIKLGGIIRPVAESNFRFGLSLESPTFYLLTDENGVEINAYDEVGSQIGNGHAYIDPVDYELATPWKFNFSLGHTIGNTLALGAEYQLENYRGISIHEKDGYVTDYTEYVNATVDKQLKAVHTLKLGAEVKATPELAFRAGYNYSTAAFDEGAYRSLYNFADMYIDTFTETSYENTLDLHRLTCGIGYRTSGFYADLAYQYTIQKSDFYAFDDSYTNGSLTNYLPATRIDRNRSQLSLTLGYRF